MFSNAASIGIGSIRGTPDQEAQAVWSMAFEELVPSSLERQHRDLVRIMYGAESASNDGTNRAE